MYKSIRLTINFLLITLVINAGGWTFNKEAVADVWFDEQQNYAVDSEHYSASSEVTKTVPTKIPCNHWCHSIGHFVGFHSQLASVTPEFVSEYSNQQAITFQFPLPDGLYRPPRLLS